MTQVDFFPLFRALPVKITMQLPGSLVSDFGVERGFQPPITPKTCRTRAYISSCTLLPTSEGFEVIFDFDGLSGVRTHALLRIRGRIWVF